MTLDIWTRPTLGTLLFEVITSGNLDKVERNGVEVKEFEAAQGEQITGVHHRDLY